MDRASESTVALSLGLNLVKLVLITTSRGAGEPTTNDSCRSTNAKSVDRAEVTVFTVRRRTGKVGDGRFRDAIPERSPTGPALREVGPAVGIGLCAPHVVERTRALSHVSVVEDAQLPAGEMPVAIPALVAIQAADRDQDPAIATLVFGSAVDSARGPAGAFEINHLPDGLVHRLIETLQRGPELRC